MKRRLVVLLSFALVLFALAPAAMARHGNGNGAHVAPLNSDQEVRDGQTGVVDSDATGNAIFKFSERTLHYKLIVANIEDVVAAHIHCGVAGANGPVGLTLFTGGPTSVSGVLFQATVSAPDDGNLCGWTTLGHVLDAIENDAAYVNVHTLANPPGEIRGQIH